MTDLTLIGNGEVDPTRIPAEDQPFGLKGISLIGSRQFRYQAGMRFHTHTANPYMYNYTELMAIRGI